MNPYKLREVYKYLTRAKKTQPDLPDVFPASKAPVPAKTQNVQEIEAINAFIRRERQQKAGGGMLVQPGFGGVRQGYAESVNQKKAREYLKNLPKNSNVVVLDIAKELEIDRGNIDRVLKEKEFKNKKFNLLRRAGGLTNKQFAEEYKKFQKSDFFKKGFDKEFAEYLNDAGFKPGFVKKGEEGKWTAETVSTKKNTLNIKTVSPKVNVLTDKEILKEAKRFNINKKGLSPDELRIKVKTARRDEKARIREQEDPEYKEKRKQDAKIRSAEYYKKQLSTKEGRAKLLERRRKAQRNQFKKLGFDPLATNADEAIWRDAVLTANKNADGKGRFSINSGYFKTMDAKDFYSNKIKIKDNQTGKIFNYNNFKNYVNKNAASFGLKNYNEAIKSYRQKFFISEKSGLRQSINLALIPDYNIDPKKYDPRSAYTIQHDFGRQSNPLKTSLAFYDDNLNEYRIRTDFENAWAKSKKSKTPLTDRKKAFNVFKKDLADLNVQSVPSMVKRERFFGKGLDLTDILKTAKKEGAILPRGVLKEAKIFLQKIGCPGFQAADGGRATFDVGTNCQMKGANLINSGMKNASPAQLKNFAAFANRTRALGSGIMKYGVIPEAMYVAADAAIRLTLGDKPTEALLRASEYLLPGDQTKRAEMMEATRLANPEIAAIIGRSIDYKNQLEKVQSLKDQKANLENLSGGGAFDYVGDTSQDVKNIDAQLKQATDDLNNKFKITEPEMIYAKQMQDEVDDARSAGSLFTKLKSKFRDVEPDSDIETLGVPEQTQADLNKKMLPQAPKIYKVEDGKIIQKNLSEATQTEIMDHVQLLRSVGVKESTKNLLADQNVLRGMPISDQILTFGPEATLGFSGTMGEPINKPPMEKKPNIIPDMEKEIVGQTNVANPFDLDISDIGTGLRGFAAAGGGIAKSAGVDQGPPPVKGPNSQGLPGLLKRVRNY